MATTDKAKNSAQRAKGKVKEGAGQVAGDDELRAEGKPQDSPTADQDTTICAEPG
jgi:uncharacterized protein YjbJ (UPF0337 family)